MSQFAILDADYRLIETQFGDELVIFKATCVDTGEKVCIRTPGERMLSDASAVHQFSGAAARLAALAGPAVVKAHFVPPGTFDTRPYLITDWHASTLLDVLSDSSASRDPESSLERLAEFLGRLCDLGVIHGSLLPTDIYCLESDAETFVLGALPALRPWLDPEASLYSAPVDVAGTVAADAYAVGVMACAIVLPKPEFDRLFDRREAPQPQVVLEALCSHASAAVSEAVTQFLETSTTTSFAAARDKAGALQRTLKAADVPQSPPPPHAPDPVVEGAHGPVLGQMSELAVDSPPPRVPTPNLSSSQSARPSGIAKTLLSLCLLFVVCVGAWYGWQQWQAHADFELALSQATAAEREARVAGAIEHAVDEWSQAQQERESARTARNNGELATATRHADEAARVFAYAITVASQRKATLAKVRAVEALKGVDASIAEQLDGYAQVLALEAEAANRYDARAFEDAEQLYAQMTKAVDDLNHQIRADEQRLNVESVVASIVTQGMDVTSGQFATATALRRTADEAVTAGQFQVAAEHYATAAAAFETKFQALSARRIERLREVAQQAHDEAVRLGAEGLDQFDAAEQLLARALAARETETLKSLTIRFEAATVAFRQVLAKTRAGRARQVAEAALAELQHSEGAMRNLTELFDAATIQFSRGEFIEAAAVYQSVAQQATTQTQNAMHAKTDQLIAHGQQSHDTQAQTSAASSAHFDAAVDALHQAKSQRDAGEHRLAQQAAQLALREFGFAEHHGAALSALERAKAAEQQLQGLSVTVDSVAIEAARRLVRSGQEDIEANRYQSAASVFSSAIESIHGAVHTAYASELDALELEVAELNRYEDAQTNTGHVAAAKAALEDARAQRKAGAYEAAIEQYRLSLRAYAKAADELQMLEMESKFRELLARLVEAGVGTTHAQLAAAQTHVLTAKHLSSQQSYAQATEEYRGAIALAETGLSQVAKAKAVHARDAAEAVKTSADASGAAQADSYADALAEHATANEAFVLGDFAAALQHYQRSQSAFDRAALQWAARQARERAEQQRQAALNAGAKEDDVGFFEARRVFEQATTRYGLTEFAAAAETFLKAAAGYEAAARDVTYNLTEESRLRAQSLLDQVSGEPDNAAAGRARTMMVKAQAALDKGNPLMASELFEQASVEASLAVEEGNAIAAQRRTQRSREQALADGVRADDASLKAADLVVREAQQLHAASRFGAAADLFDRAREAFRAAAEKFRSVTRAFVAGSTEREMRIAHDLCLRYEVECTVHVYQAEASREVRLRPFVIDDHEVTNEEFAEFAIQTNFRTHAEVVGYSMRSAGQAVVKAPGFSWRAPAGGGTSHLRFPNRPVVHIAQADAHAYCAWAGGRLPSAEEWEYAARGDERRLFPWGDEWSEHLVRWSGDTAEGPMAVNSFPAGATPNGLHDLAGNVREWTSSAREGGAVLKGGSWVERNPANFRAAAERLRPADESSIDYGFRCAWDLGAWP